MVNRLNYQWSQGYLKHLGDVAQLNKQSIDRYRAYLRHLLVWADETLLSKSHTLRPSFPAHIVSGQVHSLAPATIRKIMQTSQRFFRWLKLAYTSQFRDLPLSWIDTLRPPRLAEAVKEHKFVSLEDMKRIAQVPAGPDNLPLWRDQAAAAMLYLSGMRASALCSLPIAAVHFADRAIHQWASLGIRTKNSKSATTYLLPITELLDIVEQWNGYIRERLPETSMWYPPIISQWGDHNLSPDVAGANRIHSLGKRLRLLFQVAELPFQSAHKFRHGHAVWALQHSETMADYKAVRTPNKMTD
jgi:integrase